MPVPRLRSAMRKIREILRLALGEGLSRRTTAAATGLPYTTVSDHIGRARFYECRVGRALPPLSARPALRRAALGAGNLAAHRLQNF